MYYKDILELDIITLIIIGNEKGIVYLGTRDDYNSTYVKDYFKDIKNQIISYFKGELKDFNFNPILNCTNFQKQVLEELQKLKYGEIISYEKLAMRINKPKAIRAVASAVAKNPILILIPCHRIIRKNKDIGNYSAGRELKNILLKIEGH